MGASWRPRPIRGRGRSLPRPSSPATPRTPRPGPRHPGHDARGVALARRQRRSGRSRAGPGRPRRPTGPAPPSCATSTVTVDANASVRHIRTVLIQDAEVVERHATAVLGFDAGQAPTIVRARTLTPDATIAAVAPEDQVIENPHAGTPLHGDQRQLVAHFPRVEPGAIVDYEVDRTAPTPARAQLVGWLRPGKRGADGPGALRPGAAGRRTAAPAHHRVAAGRGDPRGRPADAALVGGRSAGVPGRGPPAASRRLRVEPEQLGRRRRTVPRPLRRAARARSRPSSKARTLTADRPDRRARIAAIYRSSSAASPTWASSSASAPASRGPPRPPSPPTAATAQGHDRWPPHC
ncbi:MAG: DUF3857 domain-containing protein [bacterium]